MNKTWKKVAACAAGAVGVVLVQPATALACGGCFSPPEVVTTVDSHRMVIALSTERTTLWDQIRYSGNPEDFVWVLPVPSGVAQVELADPVFFDEIDQFTAPIVYPPPLPPLDCPPPPDSGDDASDDPGGWQDAGAAANDGGVTVHHEEVVGPYQTATISSDSPDALKEWLIGNGYNIPDVTLPTIAYYVEHDSAFIVMRLKPGKGVAAMQPVRVAYPGYMATFPLKMVTVGASAALQLSLFVVAEQRYEPANYGNDRVYPEDVTWDYTAFVSDYADVFQAKIEQGGGAAWITEYASPLYNLWQLTPGLDVEIASKGHKYPFLTRLRTNVLPDNIGADLQLGPAVDASEVSNELFLTKGVNLPDRQCPDWNGDGEPDTWDDYDDGDGDTGSSVDNGNSKLRCQVGGGASGVLGVLAAISLLRRRRRRA